MAKVKSRDNRGHAIPVRVDGIQFDSVSAAARHLKVDHKVFSNTLEIREAYGREIEYKGHLIYASIPDLVEPEFEMDYSFAPGLSAFLARAPLERQSGKLLPRVIVRG